jgi:signal transduction histidine kinase/vacuolar-type H+-ATPase subunit F/Vma7
MKKIVLLVMAVYSFALNILVLNSYSSDLEWTEAQVDAIVKSLKNMNIENLNIYVEFMDTKKFPLTEKRDKNFLEYMTKKYKGISFDIVITTDDNALNFVRKHKNHRLFKKAKVFFQGVNNLSLAHKLDKNVYAGIFEKKEPLLQLEFAKKIMPNLKTVYIFSDTSVSGKKTIAQYKKAFKNIKNINFVYIQENDIKKILNELKNYDKNSVLMALTISIIKKNNEILSPWEVLKLVSDVYKNPIIIHTDVWTSSSNSNVVGGVCTDAKTQSRLNMEKLLQYLHGVPMENIGFKENNVNRLFINVKNIRKFGIDENKIKIDHLPIKYVNKPTSLYELYKWQIWTAIIVFVLIIIFLIILAKKNRELNLYSRKIEEINKNLEEKIQKAVDENIRNLRILQQQSKLAAMGEMIGMIAHQWRQPLNALALNLQFLPEMFENECDEKVIKEMKEFVKENMQTIKFMSNTINDFRNFFKKDKEEVEFDLAEELQKVLDMQKAQLKDNNIKVITDLKPIKIKGYKNELKQVILNLISNAKDALIKNNVKDPFIKITDYKDGNNVIITVEDNGGGIPKDIMENIFEPYFTTKEEQGTGLGLYMSNEIIKRMSGKIEVENTNNGAKFIIRLSNESN